MKVLAKAVLAMILCLPLSINAYAAEKMHWRISTGEPAESEVSYISIKFAELIKEKTNGQITADVFLSNSLADETESLRNAQKGTLEMTCVGIANLIPFENRIGVLSLPYLFKNLDEVVAFTTGKGADLINKYAQSVGFRILGYAYTDFRYFSNSKHPIYTMADMKGLKFRVPPSAPLIETYKAFGASPTPISWQETFTALQQGVVDGQCYGYVGFKAMKFDEANQKYISEIHYSYQLQPFVMSERIFKQLPADLQQKVIEAGLEAQEAALKYEIDNLNAAKAYLIEKGVKINQIENEKDWEEVARTKVWPKLLDFIGGKEVLNEFLESCGMPAWNEK